MGAERTASRGGGRRFLTGTGKWLLYARVALHVALRAAKDVLRGTMTLRAYPGYLRRAGLFLATVRHGKVAIRGRRHKLHLYIPAYPTRAFWHALEKLRRPDPGPITVVLSMTRACTYHCPHCYQARDRGRDLPLDDLLRAGRDMQEAGVSLFDIEGGEPLQRTDRMVALAETLDDRAEIWMNTTGAHLTDDKVERLVRAGLSGVMVSVHSADAEAHDRFTGVPGSFDAACAALRAFGRRGVFTALNCCPAAESIRSGGAEALVDLAASLGCDFVQLIHGKAAGAWLGAGDDVYADPGLIEALESLHVRRNGGDRFRNGPAVSAQVFEEARSRFGCTAGGVDRFYLGADGEVQPCEFLNVSFGNVREEGFPAVFARMRDHFAKPGSDWLCCTQAESIHRALREHGVDRTPIPWEITRRLVGTWNRGEETPLYRKLGIYSQS